MNPACCYEFETNVMDPSELNRSFLFFARYRPMSPAVCQSLTFNFRFLLLSSMPTQSVVRRLSMVISYPISSRPNQNCRAPDTTKTA